jgi:hypothetical protein
LSVRAKDLLGRAKLLLWGANRIGDRGRIAPAPDLNPIEHAPEQPPLRLAVADLAATNKCSAQSNKSRSVLDRDEIMELADIIRRAEASYSRDARDQ